MYPKLFIYREDILSVSCLDVLPMSASLTAVWTRFGRLYPVGADALITRFFRVVNGYSPVNRSIVRRIGVE